MIKQLPLTVMQSAFNEYLKADPQNWQAIQGLAGHTLKIELPDWWIAFEMVFADDGVHLHPAQEQTHHIDATIKGRLRSLLHLAANPDTPITAVQGIELAGNVDLIKRLASIMQRMDVDWEEKLSQWTGDIVAHQAAKTWQSLMDWGRHSSQSLKENLSEYLHEELGYFPTKDELESFYHDVSELRNDADRVEAKFRYLFGEIL